MKDEDLFVAKPAYICKRVITVHGYRKNYGQKIYFYYIIKKEYVLYCFIFIG